MSNFYETIVVGLGAAGVTAASTLAKAGKRVLGLEADNRIGGRVKTVPFGDGLVELGAEWIHGTVNNKVYDAAVQNKVPTLEKDLVCEMFRSDGRLVGRELANELMKFYYRVLSESTESEKPQPLGQYFTSRLMEYLKEKHPEVLKDQDFVKEFLQMIHLYSNYEGTNDWNELVVQTSYVELGGHLYASWHRHGYETFFEILLNTYRKGPGLPSLDTKLNKEVTQIKWPRDSTGDVEVTCKDGDKYTANNVIVTVSLGVLKERFTTLFSPMLPTDKIIAIDKLAYGVNGKIVLSFPDQLPTNSKHYMFCWSAEDVEKLDKNDKWLAKLGPSVTLPSGSSNTMTLWTSGDVTKMVETLPENVVKMKTMEILRRFLGKYITLPEPTGMIRSTWYKNPFTRGSYSYENLEMHQYPNARTTLGEPLLDATGVPRVLFAGEATDLTHFSTVHGASDSGYREAIRLLKVVE